MLDNPFREEIFPDIQSKPPLAQLEAISSRPITCYLGEETDPHLSTTSFQWGPHREKCELSTTRLCTPAADTRLAPPVPGCPHSKELHPKFDLLFFVTSCCVVYGTINVDITSVDTTATSCFYVCSWQDSALTNRRIRLGNFELNRTHTRPLDLMGCTEVLRELADIIMRPLLIVFERSGRTGESKKLEPGNYRLINLTSISGKVMDQLILETISKHTKNRKVMGVVSMDLCRGNHA
ncbi:hypothetical protein QYF61_004822 [Mycteria americana]|uniref:Uncharacterized protein n=1 Tax=Mycteria americana TaxID=33587 RepID=A0AAN7MXK0_MYCAM|nr:hypothetical protein QYF61_004822 [Mycteria americana]